ncbi:cytokine-like protein 1 [Salvelinus fontinalis]|uniref:cytokine-like protein 1 n=1 Tax=Salvelinus fontinalis TaxID=8038 RepID=UPI002485B55F|nr:cytokine-like protein 1 [Salvelinus fontinalis]
MRLALLLCFFSFIWLADCVPPTCYSRVLGLSKEIIDLLEKLNNYHRTKTCVEILPKMFLDVQNSCINTKLRDFLYVMENLPTQYCRERPRIVLLKQKVTNLYRIINRICYRDLVYFTDDCEAIETGQSTPHYREDRLQLLVEEKR